MLTITPYPSPPCRHHVERHHLRDRRLSRGGERPWVQISAHKLQHSLCSRFTKDRPSDYAYLIYYQIACYRCLLTYMLLIILCR